MKEQTILQCARCLSHTPLIETDTAESIMEAIAKHKHCGVCGSRAMLCYSSKVVPIGKGKTLSWRSANGNSASRKKHRRGNKPISRGHKASAAPLPSLRLEKDDDYPRDTRPQRRVSRA